MLLSEKYKQARDVAARLCIMMWPAMLCSTLCTDLIELYCAQPQPLLHTWDGCASHDEQ